MGRDPPSLCVGLRRRNDDPHEPALGGWTRRVYAFRRRVPAPGDYEVTVKMPGYETVSLPVTADPANEVVVRATLRRAAK